MQTIPNIRVFSGFPGGVLGVIGVLGVLLGVFLKCTGGQDGTKKGIERLEVAKNGISKSVFFQCKNLTFGDLDAAKTMLRGRVSDECFERASYPI